MFARRLGAFLIALAAGWVAPALADKAHDEIRVVWRTEAPLLDLYFTTVPEAISMSHLVWDRLVERDPATFEYKPGLATAWRWLDGRTLEFELRHGVKFHDGSDFDAEDVVHTFNWIVNPDNKVMYKGTVGWIDHAEKIDPYKVRLHLKQAFPQALEYIALPLPIYSRAYNGPQDLTKNPIGTGPYRLAGYSQTKEYRFERFDGYYDGSVKGRPAISKVTIRVVPDQAAELAELLSGRADWIYQVSSDQVQDLKARPGLQAFGAEVLRVGFITLDAAGRTGAGSPVTKVAVRQALAYALDRDSLVGQLMQGAYKVVDTPCNPRNFGCDPAAAFHYTYDPKKAKDLLAQAGYPNGFDLDLFTSNVRPREWSEAIQQNWEAIGVRTRLTMMPPQAVNDRLQQQGLPAYFNDWGGFRINDASAFISIFFRGSPDDLTRDPEVMKWLEAADTSPDPKIRQENYAKAIHKVTSDADIIPLNSFSINYAATKDLDFVGYRDEIPRFYLYRWK